MEPKLQKRTEPTLSLLQNSNNKLSFLFRYLFRDQGKAKLCSIFMIYAQKMCLRYELDAINEFKQKYTNAEDIYVIQDLFKGK